MDKWKRLKQLVEGKVDELEGIRGITDKIDAVSNTFKMVLDKMEELEAAEGKSCESCTHFGDKVACCVCKNKDGYEDDEGNS
jgi:hypothetical protein